MKYAITVIVAVVFIGLMPASVSAAAYSPYSQACSTEDSVAVHPDNSPNNSATCTSNNSGEDNINGSNGVLKKTTNIVALVAGIAAIIVIIIGGLSYVTSNGDAQKAASARSLVLGAVIGLVIIIAATGIVRLILNKL